MRKKIIDPTGTPLTPSRQGFRCKGNGKHKKYEWCCEECDYFYYCFPQFYPQIKKKELRAQIKKELEMN